MDPMASLSTAKAEPLLAGGSRDNGSLSSQRAENAFVFRRGTSWEHHGSLDTFLHEAASKYSLPLAFLLAVIRVESNFNPRAVSRVGAIGLMQIMPRNIEMLRISDPYDPRQNILGGAHLLRLFANMWAGDLVLTLASYNAGPGAVRRALSEHGEKIPRFKETRRYVQRVLRHYREFRIRLPP